ncbi:hypothetical protein BYT27DRAFT_7342780 [Phlegmacium glaucopus]|nr:hypothetical protein BYT27DRAFT_7342780 [Phlegmacium glaucopus]
MDSSNGRLVLTLCKSDAKGSYYHSMISLPQSYEAAVTEARRVFQPYIGWRFQASDIVLKCAIKRANGTVAWGILPPTDWSVIRPDGDEVGVFISQDSLDLPYEPMEGDEGGSQRPISQRQYNDHPSHTPGIQILTLKRGPAILRNLKSVIIVAPETYQECQAAAYNAFKYDFDTVKEQSEIILQSNRRYGDRDVWSVITPELYDLFLLEGGDYIELWVDDPPKQTS